MKKRKRWLSLGLSLCVAVSMITPAAAEYTDDDEIAEAEAVMLLSATDVVDGYDSVATPVASGSFTDAFDGKLAISSEYDVNNDRRLTYSELANIKKLKVTEFNGGALDWAKYFINLETLDASGVQLRNIDLSENEKLQFVNLHNTGLVGYTKASGVSFAKIDTSDNSVDIDVDKDRRINVGDIVEDIFDSPKLTIKNGGTLLVDGVLQVDRDANFVDYEYNTGDGTVFKGVFNVNADVIGINETYFPDATFRNYVAKFNTDGQDGLSKAELKAVKNIDVGVYGEGQKISSLRGIEYFTELETLDCNDNNIAELDLSQNTNLKRLYCNNNALKKLDVSALAELEALSCVDAGLTELDITMNTKLEALEVGEQIEGEASSENQNKLTKLDLSKNTLLSTLHCENSQIEQLVLPNNSNLTYIGIGGNKLSALDLRNTGIIGSGEVSYIAQNTHYIKAGNGETFDMSTICDITKVKNLAGGVLEGNTLTINEDATEVTYDYDTGVTGLLLPVKLIFHKDCTWSGEYTETEDSHYYECTVCGAKKDEEYHEYTINPVSNNNGTHNAACKCGKTITEECYNLEVYCDTQNPTCTGCNTAFTPSIVKHKGRPEPLNVPAVVGDTRYTGGIVYSECKHTVRAGSVVEDTTTDDGVSVSFNDAAYMAIDEAATGGWVKVKANDISDTYRTVLNNSQLTALGNRTVVGAVSATAAINNMGEQKVMYTINDSRYEGKISGKVLKLNDRAKNTSERQIVIDLSEAADGCDTIIIPEKPFIMLGKVREVATVKLPGNVQYEITKDNGRKLLEQFRKEGEKEAALVKEGNTWSIQKVPDEVQNKNISDFQGGTATVRLPVDLSGLNLNSVQASKLKAYHLADDGSREAIDAVFIDNRGNELNPNGYVYSEQVKSGVLKLNHFSDYVIVYEDVQTQQRPGSQNSQNSQGSSYSGAKSYYYTVKFNSLGGMAVDSVRVAKNEKLTEPNPPTKGAFIFEGWYTDRACTEKYDFSAPVTSGFTLYAKWGGSENPFTDVSESDWFYDNVMYSYREGLMNGVSDTLYAPNDNITRAMFVTILYRAEGEPPAAKLNFMDVEAGQYYTEAVAWANANEIVKGISDTEFAPDNNITREQMAAILFRYAQYKGVELAELAENLGGFTDSDKISEYAVSALNWAVGNGIINGRPDNTLDPTGTATRAEAAAMLQRLLDRI